MSEELLPFCECGCGERVTKEGNRFIHGHNRRGKTNSPEHCAAISESHTGVPNPHTSPAQIAADKAKRGVPLLPGHCAAISESKLGVPHTSPAQIAADEAHGKNMRGIPLSPEHCDAISAGKIGVPHTSPAQIAGHKAQIETMRGGNDIVTHHYIYDHDDLSLNTVQMTRSDHGRLHRLLQILGYIVPHINR